MQGLAENSDGEDWASEDSDFYGMVHIPTADRLLRAMQAAQIRVQGLREERGGRSRICLIHSAV